MASDDPRPSGKASAPRARRAPPPAAPPKSDSSWSWVGAAAVLVGGALLVRTVMRGTAPSTTSNLNMYRNAAKGMSDKPPSWRKAAPEYRPEAGTMGAGGRRATPASEQTQQSYTHFKQQQDKQKAEEKADEQWEQQQRERAYDASQKGATGSSDPTSSRWHRQSDFARYDAFQQAAREHFASQMHDAGPGGGKFVPLIDVDRSFDFNRNQARADYVQSKFMHLKKGSKKIHKYESWTGRSRSPAEGDEFDDEFAAAAEGDESQGAFKAIQRQLATAPRYVVARQLLFGTPTTEAASFADASEPAATPASPFLRAGKLGQSAAGPAILSVNAVRTAYFLRAKQCHPDVPGGGNREQFQRLTDAYDLLIGTLAPLEGRRKQMRSAQQPSNSPQPPSGS